MPSTPNGNGHAERTLTPDEVVARLRKVAADVQRLADELQADTPDDHG